MLHKPRHIVPGIWDELDELKSLSVQDTKVQLGDRLTCGSAEFVLSGLELHSIVPVSRLIERWRLLTVQ